MRVFTVGHSTHSLDELHALLAQHDVGRVADVRRVPHSARHPQFRAEALAAELPKRSVEYRHMPVLGGWRRPLPDSPNGGWDMRVGGQSTGTRRSNAMRSVACCALGRARLRGSCTTAMRQASAVALS
jgi:hypothetical protein